MLTITDTLVWDFWLAQDDQTYHLFFLNAPAALAGGGLRHRAARIGHATSEDLVHWTVLPRPFDVGSVGTFDETATWTGSVVRGGDGRWRMFYTGARFLADYPDMTNIETVGVAVSDDLRTWVKQPGPVVRADPRWYETLGSSSWPEEAWRDPYVFPAPDGHGWHMLITARANHGPDNDRGVIGHAYSTDLATWEVRPPLSEPGAGFGHLEVPQVVLVEGQWMLLFGCTPKTMTPEHAARHPRAGTWLLPLDDPTGPYDTAAAVPLTASDRYCGRLVRRPDQTWAVMAFSNGGYEARFDSAILDPLRLEELIRARHLR